MKKLIVLAFAFFALAAMAGEPKKGELSPKKEAVKTRDTRSLKNRAPKRTLELASA